MDPEFRAWKGRRDEIRRRTLLPWAVSGLAAEFIGLPLLAPITAGGPETAGQVHLLGAGLTVAGLAYVLVGSWRYQKRLTAAGERPAGS